MIRYLALVVAMTVGGLVVAQQPPPPPTPDKATGTDLDKFVGTWNVTSLTRDGKSDDEKLKDMKLKVAFTKDREIRYQANGKDVARATFKLETSTGGAPARLTTTSAKGHDELGIYQFKGDDGLELCVAPNGADRPTMFKGDMGNTFITFKREKEAAPKPAEEKKDPKADPKAEPKKDAKGPGAP